MQVEATRTAGGGNPRQDPIHQPRRAATATVMEDLGEIDCSVLKRLLKDDSAKCLLLDCRSFLAFSAGRIRGAVNARCNTIVRRRAKGSALSLDQVLAGDEEVRGRLRCGMFSAAVLYDERTPDAEALKEDSTLAVVLNALCGDAGHRTRIYLLKGTGGGGGSSSLLLQIEIYYYYLLTCSRHWSGPTEGRNGIRRSPRQLLVN